MFKSIEITQQILSSDIFVIADHHFGHSNIIKYESRPFIDVNEMDNEMIKRWNEVITKDDIVFHLGDFSFYGTSKTKDISDQLNGTKYLLYGNHDLGRSKTWFENIGFKQVWHKSILGIRFDGVIFSHQPINFEEREIDPVINIHGHVHSNTFSFYDPQYHYCVSVERLNYYPIRIKDIILDKNILVNSGLDHYIIRHE